MKEFWEKLKNSNEKLFKEFIELMHSLEFTKNNDLSCDFRDGEFILIYWGMIITERKIVALNKNEQVKSFLKKIFPDKITFVKNATFMDYHLIIGFLEELCRLNGYEITILRTANGERYVFDIHWMHQGKEGSKPQSRCRNFHYEEQYSYEHAHKGAIVECFKMIKDKK